MSNELVKTESKEIDFLVDLQNTEALVQKLMASKHYAKMGPDGVYAIVHKAKALNVSPVDALNGALYFVQGKVGMSTELMACLIRAQGHSIVRDKSSTETKCVLVGKRKDNGDTWQASFSLDDARKAGLAKAGSPWEKYPDVMCYNRAMAKLARQLFPDIIKGCGYTHDELKEIASSKSMIEESVEVYDVKPAAELISDLQILALKKIIERCKVPPNIEAIVFERLRVSTYEAIPAAKFDAIYRWVEEKVKAQEAPQEAKIESITIEPTVVAFALEKSVFDTE